MAKKPTALVLAIQTIPNGLPWMISEYRLPVRVLHATEDAYAGYVPAFLS